MNQVMVFHHQVFPLKAAYFAAHSTLFTIVVVLVFWARMAAPIPISSSASLGLLLLLVVLQVCFALNGVDKAIVHDNSATFLAAIGKSVGLAAAPAAFLFIAFPDLWPGSMSATLPVALSILVLFAMRPPLQIMIRHKKMMQRQLILGSGDLARKYYQELVSDGAHTHDAGVIIRNSELRDLALQKGISRIVVAESDPPASEELAAVLLGYKIRGLKIVQAAESYEQLRGKIWLEALPTAWTMYSEGCYPSEKYLRVKAVLEFIGALLLLIITAPVLALVALAIKLTSPGPVLFRQTRVKQYGEPFVVYKFRSMREDAEAQSGPVWSEAGDPRITPLGRILRQFRLDELPQLFNVLRGEMSLVGPRPERPAFVTLLREHIPHYDLRHYVKPGITGWAQVSCGYASSIKDSYEKLQYDLYYARHISFRLDLLTLAKTVNVVLFGRGR
jgi:exopolysaccharide biosynthesis polyprenyl glycosylphosphotransferase